MRSLEKKASNRRYRVRRDPVTHFLNKSAAEQGRRRAICYSDSCWPRHDDGFTSNLIKVDCDRCKKLLPSYHGLQGLFEASKKMAPVADHDALLRSLLEAMKPLDDLLKAQSTAMESVKDLILLSPQATFQADEIIESSCKTPTFL